MSILLRIMLYHQGPLDMSAVQFGGVICFEDHSASSLGSRSVAILHNTLLHHLPWRVSSWAYACSGQSGRASRPDLHGKQWKGIPESVLHKEWSILLF